MIYRLRHLIPDASCGVEIPATGQWVRAVPEPPPNPIQGRIEAAWAVLCGRALAVTWPKDGEFEQAVALSERRR